MAKLQFSIRNTALATLCLASLGACQHTDVGVPSPQDQMARNEVQLVRLSHLIAAEDDGTDTPSVVTYAALGAFLESVDVGAYDTIVLDAGAVSELRLREIEKFIRKRGLTFGGIAPMGATPGAGAIALYVERYVATPPDCGIWPDERSNNTRNNTSGYFGCANTGNLGLMVANPRDLIAGQAGGNSTGAAVSALNKGNKPAAGPGITLSLGGLEGAVAGAEAAASATGGNN
ncbi:MAG: hypothetical protein EP335_18170 [Alphaproteobacteria bacterium]|nr:MAG: hypothetical protein EP335_18170 [Alphaproteobacteria bacterium]